MTNGIKKTKNPMTVRRWGEFVVLIVVVLVVGYAFSSCSKTENKVDNTNESLPVNESEISAVPVINPNLDFSEFQHSDPAHARFPCALCHERKDNSATPKLSGHLPCASCHVQQFADKNSAICTICHKDAETADVKSFPALKSFNAVFNHAKHLGPTNCATCHKPTGNGKTFTIPSGLNTHNTCFSCHSPGAKSGEKEIDSCNVCHQEGNFVKVSAKQSRVFQTTPFSHANHRLVCTDCHTVKTGAGRGTQVSTSLVAEMHFPPKNSQSCASCHNSKRAFGFASCQRCHQGNDFVRKAERSSVFRTTPFSHVNHKLDCNTCHKSSGGRIITSLVAKMHFPPKNAQSCASCHNNKRAFGGDDFSDCKRCHKGNSFRF